MEGTAVEWQLFLRNPSAPPVRKTSCGILSARKIASGSVRDKEEVLMGKKFAGQMDKGKAGAVEQPAYRFEGFPSQGQVHLLSQFISSARFL